MTRRPAAAPPSCRRGSALLIAVVALALVAVVMTAILLHSVSSHRLLDQRQRQLQAEALARSGVELAADHLLSAPAGYQGETVEPLPGGRVRIEVRADTDLKDVFHVTCQARYAGDGRDTVLRSARRSFRRIVRDKQVRLEVVPEH
jgi:hypothetical protein